MNIHRYLSISHCKHRSPDGDHYFSQIFRSLSFPCQSHNRAHFFLKYKNTRGRFDWTICNQRAAKCEGSSGKVLNSLKSFKMFRYVRSTAGSLLFARSTSDVSSKFSAQHVQFTISASEPEEDRLRIYQRERGHFRVTSGNEDVKGSDQ